MAMDDVFSSKHMVLSAGGALLFLLFAASPKEVWNCLWCLLHLDVSGNKSCMPSWHFVQMNHVVEQDGHSAITHHEE